MFYTMMIKNSDNGHTIKLYIKPGNVSLLRLSDPNFKKMAIAHFAFDLDDDKLIKNTYSSNLDLFEEFLMMKNL